MTEQVETQTESPRRRHQPVSDAAAGKVKSLLDQEGRDDLKLRIAVQPGGCSGLRYQLFFDERDLDGDVVTDFDGVERRRGPDERCPTSTARSSTSSTPSRSRASRSTTPTPAGSCACGDSFH